MRAPEELLCSRGWRLRHGLWMLWGILSFGLLWSIGFAIIGFRARNRTWLIFSAIWLAYLVAYIATSSALETPENGDPATPMSSVFALALFASWIGGGVLAWFVNRKWLVWRAHNARRGPWYLTATATPGAADPGGDPAAPASPAAAVDHALRTSMSEYGSGDPPTAAAPPQVSTTAGPSEPDTLHGPAPRFYGAQHASGATAAAAPIDLNTATREQLASLPGIDSAWADHIIATRQHIGGFASPADLVTAASVQPHVFADIRDRLVANPPAAPEHATRPDGRRLEF